jgi:hypothetical protein
MAEMRPNEPDPGNAGVGRNIGIYTITAIVYVVF